MPGQRTHGPGGDAEAKALTFMMCSIFVGIMLAFIVISIWGSQ